jgi:ubiquinone biosynthesis protein UbiJ
MSLHKTRGSLYKLARILGDVQAVSSGSGKKIARRAGRRVVGKRTGKFLRNLFK